MPTNLFDGYEYKFTFKNIVVPELEDYKRYPRSKLLSDRPYAEAVMRNQNRHVDFDLISVNMSSQLHRPDTRTIGGEMTYLSIDAFDFIRCNIETYNNWSFAMKDNNSFELLIYNGGSSVVELKEVYVDGYMQLIDSGGRMYNSLSLMTYSATSLLVSD